MVLYKTKAVPSMFVVTMEWYYEQSCNRPSVLLRCDWHVCI
jgi:hypothetical protein